MVRATRKLVDVCGVLHHSVVKQHDGAKTRRESESSADKPAPEADPEGCANTASPVGGDQPAYRRHPNRTPCKPGGEGVNARMKIAEIAENGCASQIPWKNLTHPHRPDQQAKNNAKPFFHRGDDRSTSSTQRFTKDPFFETGCRSLQCGRIAWARVPDRRFDMEQRWFNIQVK
jgi:hypothetical protein